MLLMAALGAVAYLFLRVKASDALATRLDM
ncbi:hypothetical protein X748_02690 [Mesorhizobium sp. LNJC386A00]|nr:hypothetical protein X748_02690 [Mesorhizobium sp. LNJC386A00]